VTLISTLKHDEFLTWATLFGLSKPHSYWVNSRLWSQTDNVQSVMQPVIGRQHYTKTIEITTTMHWKLSH